MKKVSIPVLVALCTLVTILCVQNPAIAQQKSPKKKQVIEIKASSSPTDEVTSLKRPANEKDPKPQPKVRGEVYGPDYSDIIVDNYTGYSIDIYVDGSFRGTIAAYDKKVTWAVPGSTRLYAKAVFDDGSYIYWGPSVTYTGYEYTWRLRH